MSLIERCPTCGAAVRVVGGDEGTSHYEPITAIDALAKEVAPMTEQLRGAVEAFVRYGQHLPDCTIHEHPPLCTCGYNTALAALPGGQ